MCPRKPKESRSEATLSLHISLPSSSPQHVFVEKEKSVCRVLPHTHAHCAIYWREWRENMCFWCVRSLFQCWKSLTLVTTIREASRWRIQYDNTEGQRKGEQGKKLLAGRKKTSSLSVHMAEGLSTLQQKYVTLLLMTLQWPQKPSLRVKLWNLFHYWCCIVALYHHNYLLQCLVWIRCK